MLDSDVKKRTQISVALTKIGNLHDVIDFARSCSLRVSIFPIRNFRRAYDLTHEIIEEEISPNIMQIAQNNRDVIFYPCRHTIRKLIAVQNGEYSWWMPCTMPFESLILDYFGNIRMCCGDQPPIGKAADLPHILDNEISRKILFEANRRLGVCSYCSFSIDQCLRCLAPSRILSLVKRALFRRL